MVCGCHRIDRQLWRIEGFRRHLYEAAHLREPSRRACPESPTLCDATIRGWALRRGFPHTLVRHMRRIATHSASGVICKRPISATSCSSRRTAGKTAPQAAKVVSPRRRHRVLWLSITFDYDHHIKFVIIVTVHCASKEGNRCMRKIWGWLCSKDKAKEECLLRAGCRDSHRAWHGLRAGVAFFSAITIGLLTPVHAQIQAAESHPPPVPT